MRAEALLDNNPFAVALWVPARDVGKASFAADASRGRHPALEAVHSTFTNRVLSAVAPWVKQLDAPPKSRALRLTSLEFPLCDHCKN